MPDEDKEANKNLRGMGGICNPINFALYHFAGNNPIRYTDPDGRFSAYLHGGAAGTLDNNKAAGAIVMEPYRKLVEAKVETGPIIMPNFSYIAPTEAHNVVAHDTQVSIAALGQMPWSADGNNKIVGFSVGADTTAGFLLKTDKHFKLAILDGTKTQNLSPEKLRVMASKVDQLIIVSHNRDYMDGNLISGLLGGGDRKLDGSTNEEKRTLAAIAGLPNVKLVNIDNSHELAPKPVADAISN